MFGATLILAALPAAELKGATITASAMVAVGSVMVSRSACWRRSLIHSNPLIALLFLVSLRVPIPQFSPFQAPGFEDTGTGLNQGLRPSQRLSSSKCSLSQTVRGSRASPIEPERGGFVSARGTSQPRRLLGQASSPPFQRTPLEAQAVGCGHHKV